MSTCEMSLIAPSFFLPSCPARYPAPYRPRRTPGAGRLDDCSVLVFFLGGGNLKEKRKEKERRRKSKTLRTTIHIHTARPLPPPPSGLPSKMPNLIENNIYSSNW